jgi:hypothetical protein
VTINSINRRTVKSQSAIVLEKQQKPGVANPSFNCSRRLRKCNLNLSQKLAGVSKKQESPGTGWASCLDTGERVSRNKIIRLKIPKSQSPKGLENSEARMVGA